MPRRYLMSDVMTWCKQRCDLEGSDVISDAEWKSLISEAYGDLYSTVAESGLDYFQYSFDITSDGSASYDEPDGHLSTIGLDYVDSAGRRHELHELMQQELARWSGRTGNRAVAFAHVDDLIYLYPPPAAGQTYKMRYIPQPPNLRTYADDDAIDVVTPDGESFLVWAVTVKAKAKTETDASLALRERDEARAKLHDWAVLKAFNTPRRRVLQADHAEYGDLEYDEASWRYR